MTGRTRPIYLLELSQILFCAFANELPTRTVEHRLLLFGCCCCNHVKTGNAEVPGFALSVRLTIIAVTERDGLRIFTFLSFLAPASTVDGLRFL